MQPDILLCSVITAKLPPRPALLSRYNWLERLSDLAEQPSKGTLSSCYEALADPVDATFVVSACFAPRPFDRT